MLGSIYACIAAAREAGHTRLLGIVWSFSILLAHLRVLEKKRSKGVRMPGFEHLSHSFPQKALSLQAPKTHHCLVRLGRSPIVEPPLG